MGLPPEDQRNLIVSGTHKKVTQEEWESSRILQPDERIRSGDLYEVAEGSLYEGRYRVAPPLPKNIFIGKRVGFVMGLEMSAITAFRRPKTA